MINRKSRSAVTACNKIHQLEMNQLLKTNPATAQLDDQKGIVSLSKVAACSNPSHAFIMTGVSGARLSPHLTQPLCPQSVRL